MTHVPDTPSPKVLHGFACSAMGTRFELELVCEDAAYAKQLATQAFERVVEIERDLSRFRPASDVAQLNRAAKGQTLRVGPDACECLRLAADACQLSGGTFDVTIGALRDLWARATEAGVEPAEQDIAGAMQSCGMEQLELDGHGNLVVKLVDGLLVDLGGIGKGYAVDCMAELLADWDIGSALVHGGESTIRGLGAGPDGTGWPVALRNPTDRERALKSVTLGPRALSGSGQGIHGRHILDPRTGRPAEARPAAWVAAPSAAMADALSTACMVLNTEEVRGLCDRCPEISAVLFEGEGRLTCFGRPL